MISAKNLGSVAAAGHYFYEHQGNSQGEYYAKEQAPSTWGGEGAAYAGMSVGGEVNRQDFEKILGGELYNRRDEVTQHLGRTTKDGTEHRPGLDLTFSAPKSVSLLSEVGGDERVRAAHEASVERAMGFLEKHASQARVMADGNKEMRETGNLVYAKFSHDTSRENDPNTHTHVVVANATYDKQDGTWRSLSNEKIYDLRKTADQIYKNELAKELKSIGYEVRFDKKGSFEVEGFSKEQLQHFSKQATNVEGWLAERGMTRETASAEMRERANLETRARKQELPRDQLVEGWRNEAKSIGLDINSVIRSTNGKSSRMARSVELGEGRKSVQAGIGHLSEREAAFSKKDLWQAAARFSEGKASFTHIDGAIKNMEKSGELVKRQDGMYTTDQAVKLERELSKMIARGKVAGLAVAKASQIDKGIRGFEAQKGFKLNDEQAKAVELIAGSKDRFVAVQGYAGTGKTTMLEAVKNIAETQGYKVIGMSVGSNQAAILEQDSGIKSQTVASFLREQQKIDRAAAKTGQPQSGNSKSTKMMDKPGGRFLITKNGVFVARTGLLSIKNKVALKAQDKFATARLQAKSEGRVLSQFGNYLAERAFGSMVKWEKAGLVEAGLVRANHAISSALQDHKTGMASKGLSALGIREKQLWVVDESSMMSQKDMNAVMQYAEARGAKVVFTGDKAQHQSVEAGRASDLALKNGIAQAELKQVSRQKDDVGRAAVKDVISGQTKEAFSKLPKVEDRDHGALISKIAKDYVQSEHRESTVVVTATNADRREINASIREELKAQGHIAKNGVTHEVLTRKDLTSVEAKIATSYRPGDVLKAGRDYSRLEANRGDYLRVEKVDSRTNSLRVTNDRTGKSLSINPTQNTRFKSFTASTQEFSKGDRIRFNAIDKDSGLKNGQTAKVESVTDRAIVARLDDGRTINVETDKYKHVDHGYTSTSYGSQGATKDKTMLHINTKSGMAVGDRSFYVGVTRARQGTTVYTDNAEKASQMVGRHQDKTAATDSVQRDDQTDKLTNTQTNNHEKSISENAGKQSVSRGR